MKRRINMNMKRAFIILVVLSMYSTTIAMAGEDTGNTTLANTTTATATATAQTTKIPTPTVTATVVQTTTQPIQTTQAPTTVTTTVGEGKFRVGPSITLRPVTEVIETNQDGIVEFFMNNPSLNDVTLNVDARISVPSGIHVYGQSFGEGAGAGVVAGTFSVPPGTSRTITLVIKADKSARIGSHTIQFTGLYWPGNDKDSFQPLSLTYSVTVNEPSKDPLKDTSGDAGGDKGKSEKTEKSPGISIIIAISVVAIMAYMLRRRN